MERTKAQGERLTVTRETFRKNVAEITQLARREGGVTVTDSRGRALFVVSTPSDKWPDESKKP